MRQVHVIVTCEHAGNEIPKAYQHLFKEKAILKTHRAIDEGAIAFAEQLSDGLRTRLFETRISRLLVECNRSLHNPQLFSEFTANLKPQAKQSILDQYYHPYRNAVEKYIATHVNQLPVLHLSMHTFTPILNDQERKFDIGLLFDESRSNELKLCKSWISNLAQSVPKFRTVANEPYKGSDDGFTTYLRTRFSDSQYMGIEIEINQKWAWTGEGVLIIDKVIQTLEHTLLNLGEPSVVQ